MCLSLLKHEVFQRNLEGSANTANNCICNLKEINFVGYLSLPASILTALEVAIILK